MKERPILFSSEMVRAILEGRKTMTRRVVKPGHNQEWLTPAVINQVARFAESINGWWTMAVGEDRRIVHCGHDMDGGHIGSVQCPYGQTGDRLWCKEHWEVDHSECDITYTDGETKRYLDQSDWFKADWLKGSERRTRSRSSRFMPRWASRILLEVVSVRVERLQDISIMDCLSEGIRCPECGYTAKDAGMHMDHAICVNKWLQDCKSGDESDHAAIVAYRELWESLYTKKPDKQWDANPFCWMIEFKVVKP